jgi:hypothetical protein
MNGFAINCQHLAWRTMKLRDIGSCSHAFSHLLRTMRYFVPSAVVCADDLVALELGEGHERHDFAAIDILAGRGD